MRARQLGVRVTLVVTLAGVIGGGIADAAIIDRGNGAAAGRRRCTPGYRPCIPNRRSDVDCYGGGGDGPRYTRPGVVYRVRGADRYGLDGDNDGRGCE